VQCFRGKPHFSRLSVFDALFATLFTSGVSKNFSSLYLLFFVESKKMGNF